MAPKPAAPAAKPAAASRPAPAPPGAGHKPAAARAIDWKRVEAALPHDKTPEQTERRKKMFREFDPNGNGYLSLAECDKGVRDVLKLDELFDAKPAIMRAFQISKDLTKSKPGSHDADYLTLPEFRPFLEYLKKYFELFHAFETLDTGGDSRLDIG